MKTMHEKFEEMCKSDDDMAIFLASCDFNEKYNVYENNTGDRDLEYYEDRLNGAWYGFQEQQKKIDEAKKEINNFFDNQTQKPTDREYCNKLADILEILK